MDLRRGGGAPARSCPHAHAAALSFLGRSTTTGEMVLGRIGRGSERHAGRGRRIVMRPARIVSDEGGSRLVVERCRRVWWDGGSAKRHDGIRLTREAEAGGASLALINAGGKLETIESASALRRGILYDIRQGKRVRRTRVSIDRKVREIRV